MRGYILIDYENVQPDDFELPSGIDWRIIFFVGPNQKKLSLKLHKQRFEVIPMTGNGKNNLDFHIAFTLGSLSESDPKAHFQIVSKDAGFDLLLEFARKKGLRCARVESLGETSQKEKTAKEPNAKPTNNVKVHPVIQSLVPVAVEQLVSSGTNRPNGITTLKNWLRSHFRHLNEKAIDQLFDELLRLKYISVNQEKIVYSSKHFASNVK